MHGCLHTRLGVTRRIYTAGSWVSSVESGWEWEIRPETGARRLSEPGGEIYRIEP